MKLKQLLNRSGFWKLPQHDGVWKHETRNITFVLVVDDLIATGGTAIAAIKLIRRLKANVLGCAFLVDLPNLKGSRKIIEMGIEVRSLCEFDGE